MAKYYDGSPLTPAVLTELLQAGGVDTTITDITVLQTHDQIAGTDKSGRHSNITRVAISTAEPCEITHLILKRVACPELSERPAAKWKRDIGSYLTDVNFYKYFAKDILPSCRVPRCFHYVSKHDSDCSDPKQCWFYLVLEDLESIGYVQSNYHELASTKLLLEWMAKFHSVTWEPSDEVKNHLWDIGSATSLEKRDPPEIEALPACWDKITAAWGGTYPDLFERMNVKQLGTRLLAMAPKLHERLEQDTQHTAIIHGDFKSANLFLHKDTQEVAVVDYQWAGAGKVVRDVVYFLWGAVAPELIVSQEQVLLKHYHETLTTKLGKEYPWDRFYSDYQIAFLDYLRHVCAYMWPKLPVTPESCERELGVWSRVVHNKSAIVVRKMIELGVERGKAFETSELN